MLPVLVSACSFSPENLDKEEKGCRAAGTPCGPAEPSHAHGAGARDQPAAAPARWGMELAEARADIPGRCFEAGYGLVLSVIKARS